MEKPKNKRHWLIIICMPCILIAGVLLTVIIANNRETEPDPYQTVAEINGIPIALGELQMFIDDVRQTTKSYFKNEHSVEDISGENWTKEFDGKSPVNYAIGLALENLTRYKMVQQACVDAGIIDDISYKAFIERWEQENADRKAKNAAGEVIYGPVEYTKSVYYDYLQDEYEQQLEAVMEIDYNDTDLMKLYEENRDLFYNFGSVTMEIIVLLQDDYSKETVADLFETLNQAVNNGESFTEEAEELGLSDFLQERTFTADDISGEDVQGYPEVQDALYDLEVGEISGIINDNDVQWLIFYCKNREGNERQDFEECKDELESMYREEYYENYISEAEGNAETIINDNARIYIK